MKLQIIKGTESTILEYIHPTLLSTLLTQTGFPIDMPCGGNQRCLKCKVIARGELSALSAKEEQFLTDEEKRMGVRFACMTTAIGDVQVTEPTQLENQQIMTDGQKFNVELAPWGSVYGVAIDIGTTTVAAYLYRIEDGQLLQTSGAKNPQSSFGADVVSRIEKALNGSAAALSSVIRHCLLDLVQQMCTPQGLNIHEVDSAVITGNTAMLYLLCEHSPASIATAPFLQDRFFGEFIQSSKLGIPELNTRVYLPRCISAYVGGDITTAMLASEVYKSFSPTLLVDIGTNGEMVLHKDSQLLGCSTAAGPAFEGAGIAMGMPAADGAISMVTLQDGLIICGIIGGVPSKGICGSGIVDAVAVMLECGIVDETGCMVEENHNFTDFMVEIDDQIAFQLPGTSVIITQKDIRAIQLGKAAICAGILTLIDSAGLTEDDVSYLLIAGGFGSFLNVQSAERIGLIPLGFAAKATAIGNAAAMGAAMILLSLPMLKKSEQLAIQTQTVELTTSASFMDTYVNCMLFS